MLCREGIYRLSRHPYYTSNYVIDLSFCLLSGNTYLLLAYPFLFFWAYGPTFIKEESYLSSKFEEYSQYRLETPQVLPDGRVLGHWRDFLRGFSIKRVTRNELARVIRFWTIACFMLLLHHLRAEGLREISPLSYRDHDRLILLACLAVLVTLQFILNRRAKEKAR